MSYYGRKKRRCFNKKCCPPVCKQKFCCDPYVQLFSTKKQWLRKGECVEFEKCGENCGVRVCSSSTIEICKSGVYVVSFQVEGGERDSKSECCHDNGDSCFGLEVDSTIIKATKFEAGGTALVKLKRGDEVSLINAGGKTHIGDDNCTPCLSASLTLYRISC